MTTTGIVVGGRAIPPDPGGFVHPDRQEYERGVIFRLGRVIAGVKGPGLFFIIPIIDRMVKVNLQIVTLDVRRNRGLR
jgi:hypothetical protein